MITLNTFGAMFGLPDPSPFVTKADVLFKMSGLPYQARGGNLREAPKGKMPFIEDKGVKIGDSTLIRMHLEKNYGVDFDRHLSPAEKGIAWSIEKMLEEHLYWALINARWINDANFDKGPRKFFASIPALMRPFIVASIRRGMRNKLLGQGFGRHTNAEIESLANRDIDSLAAILGDKPYLMGANKCGADATAFAFTIGILCPLFETPVRTHAESHKNLVAYCERMRKEFYP